jgi:hypothetical protein
MENKNEETHGNPAGNPAETQEPTNGVSTPEELEAIKAQLEEEQAALAEARAQLEQTMSEKDARIVALEAQLSQAQQATESLRAEGVAISEANARAIAKYLDAVKAANPAIPPDIIAGETIEDIDASVEKAQSIVIAVKASLEAQAKETRVPAGAPARENINLDGLSPREKIVVGIQQKQGGTS